MLLARRIQSYETRVGIYHPPGMTCDKLETNANNLGRRETFWADPPSKAGGTGAETSEGNKGTEGCDYFFMCSSKHSTC